MGEIRKYTCSCGCQKELFLGAGLQGISVNAIALHFDDDIVRQFQEHLKRGEVTTYLLENAIISCSGCKELYTVPYFHYELSDGKRQIYLKPCPTCQKPSSGIINPESVYCPKCGLKMDYEVIGDWD